ncbi:hypothetical protein GCM10011360_01750 [Primorskyibacter flagellatus]|uniref:Cupin type-2 domain-containing protein n=1 Tax=Primorskyibacter flagellatus TaxID=1387277 RepID=A0A916ZWA4_9RHOB|nr:cupin domain-containing protein [Primorskyibacter flagellatus]GGE16644.1 hypothetical protein GCM10011360_01750 [Primorskyibacter flagellatus]
MITRFLSPILAAALLVQPALADMTTARTPASDVTWLDTPFGVHAAPVHGDFTKGAHVTFVRFKAGQATPVHIHSHEYTGIIVSGVGRHYEPDKPETEVDLPAGSTWYIGANVPHISACNARSDCVFALIQDEPFDYVEGM